jgi:cell division protein FtsQ
MRLRRPKAEPVVIKDRLGSTVLAPASRARIPSIRDRRRMRAALTAVAAAVVLVLAVAGVADSARIGRLIAQIRPDFDAMVRLAGFGIDQVSLTGHRFTSDREVFDALDLANVRSIASLDMDAVKGRLERLAWVESAELTRVFPDRLDVRITERKPFAVWTRGERAYLIDQSGRVLSAVSGTGPADLPRVAGEGAASEAAAMLGLVARYPEISRRLVEAERVGERRWTLKLAQGLVLKLPPDGEAHVLDEISKDPELGRLVAREKAIIDLRARGRITVRPVKEPGAS